MDVRELLLLVGSALGGACAAPQPGVVIEVIDPDTRVDRAEVILGEMCGDCGRTLGAPGVQPREARIHTSAHSVRWMSSPEDGLAFVLRADGTSDQIIDALVIVGYDEQERPIAIRALESVVVPAHAGELWHVELFALEELDEPQRRPRDGALAASVWRHADQQEPSCVLVERMVDGVTTRTAIVPVRDPDCDRVPASLECAPYAANAQDVPPPFEGNQCVTATSDDFCILGGDPCNESGVTNDACVAVEGAPYCVSSRLCACGDGDLSCYANGILAGPRISCKIYIDSTGQPCNGQRTTTVNASALVGPGVSCQAVRVFAGILQSSHVLTGVPVGSTAELRPSNVQMPCVFDLTWLGTTTTTGTRINDYYDLELTNGRHLVLLSGVEVVSSCSAATVAMACSVDRVGDDPALVRCAE